MNEANVNRCIAVTMGVAATLLARLILVVATAPHSLILFSLHTSWYWLIAILVGFCVTVICLISSRRPGFLTAVLLLVVATASLWLVFNVPAMNHLYPGFWVK